MDDQTRTTALKYLVAQYLQSVKDVADSERRYEEAGKDLHRSKGRKGTYANTLHTEGIDPNNIPSNLLPDDAKSEQPDEDAIDGRGELEELASVKAENNGHAKASGWPTPINDTHVVFLVFKRLNNPWLDSEEVFQHNLKFGYGLSKIEVTKILGRQHPLGRFDRDGRKYKLSEEGLRFDGFRKKGERHEELPSLQL